jgi:hypothetical protein
VVTRSEAQVSARFGDFGAGFMGLFILSVCTTASLRTVHAAVAITACFTLYGLMFGLGGCYQIERLRRAEFLRRHELAEEREKTERLLKHEISHQVAERSKQLGEELARFDAPSNGVTLAPGDLFDGRYRVIRALGTGGMGAVYEVERLTDEQRFALKIITGRVSAVVAARFAREAEIGARLQHPNLVSIVDVGVSHSGGPFLVMDLVLGGTLDERSSRFGDIAWATSMLRQVADGLVALHEAGVVHRDLKPGNILLQRGGDDAEVARISDFGISRVVVVDGSVDVAAATQKASSPGTGRLTGTGTLLGTPLYMAPESAHGARGVDAPSDVWLSARAPCTPPRRVPRRPVVCRRLQSEPIDVHRRACPTAVKRRPRVAAQLRVILEDMAEHARCSSRGPRSGAASRLPPKETSMNVLSLLFCGCLAALSVAGCTIGVPESAEIDGSGVGSGPESQTVSCGTSTSLETYTAGGGGGLQITVLDGEGRRVYNGGSDVQGEADNTQQVDGAPGTWTLSVDAEGFSGQFKVTLGCL